MLSVRRAVGPLVVLLCFWRNWGLGEFLYVRFLRPLNKLCNGVGHIVHLIIASIYWIPIDMPEIVQSTEICISTSFLTLSLTEGRMGGLGILSFIQDVKPVLFLFYRHETLKKITSLFNRGNEYDTNVFMFISGTMFRVVIIIPTCKVLFLPDSLPRLFCQASGLPDAQRGNPDLPTPTFSFVHTPCC